ncbi:glutaminase [Streptomyces griseus]|uniref:glutaminase n=1 Tax=Streptomyces griseus TaxID=1911 RepID=UPI003F4D3FD2
MHCAGQGRWGLDSLTESKPQPAAAGYRGGMESRRVSGSRLRAGGRGTTWTFHQRAGTTARDLAVMAATLANRGVNPLSGEQVVPEGVVRQVLSVMFSCGMYDAAGDWATQVGIPAKSGVAGSLIGALPGRIGIATFSPRLDSHGNSVREVSLFERFSSDMGLHVMEVPSAGRAAVRSSHVLGGRSDALRVLELQGGIGFAGAERVVREVLDTDPREARVAIDLTRVHAIDDVARRMVLEIARRLTLDGWGTVIREVRQAVPPAA